MRILLVEDEIKVANFISEGLKLRNYMVTIATNGEEGISMALLNDFPVILLDYMLPLKSGPEVLKTIKESGCASKVIMLTARDEVKDKVTCLNLGADDYIVKPFDFEELLARIRVVLRREGQETNSVLSYEDLELDFNTMEVKRSGQVLDLTSQEFRLLEFFMRNRKRVVSRSQLIEQVWGDYDYGSTNKIEVYIYYLRQKIDKGFTRKLMHTSRGKGYIFK